MLWPCVAVLEASCDVYCRLHYRALSSCAMAGDRMVRNPQRVRICPCSASPPVYLTPIRARIWMAIFIGMAGVMIAGWASMFASDVFRWSFLAWDFFAFMTVAAGVLLAAAMGLGIACRLNFGKGLPEYRAFITLPHKNQLTYPISSRPRATRCRTRLGACNGENLRR